MPCYLYHIWGTILQTLIKVTTDKNPAAIFPEPIDLNPPRIKRLNEKE
jgi:hypothetical protein